MDIKHIFLFFAFTLFLFQTKAQNNPTSLSRKIINNQTPSRVNLYLTAKQWNSLFPNRYRQKTTSESGQRADFYSFNAFTTAAKYFPSFLGEGNATTRKRELAAFLANIAQETSGGWDTAEGGYFKWGLYFLEEQNNGQPLEYSDSSKKMYPPVAGKKYYGRGPKQISWNYNYGQFSEAWFGNKDSLLNHPELLSSNPVLSFASAIWFWMTEQHPKPSCHDIMTGKWVPTADDIAKGRIPGFGATVNVINGGIECGLGKDLDKTKYRYLYYRYFCKYFNVTPGENITCTDQKPFGQ